jgi:hypothetical protein
MSQLLQVPALPVQAAAMCMPDLVLLVLVLLMFLPLLQVVDIPASHC